MTKSNLDLGTLSIDEMLDLKEALEAKLTEIAKAETELMTERLKRLQTYLPDEMPAPTQAKKPAKPKAPVRKSAKMQQSAKPKTAPKAMTAKAASRTATSKAATKTATPKAAAKAVKPKTTAKSSKPAKIAPKYRDPESGKTWSGRGMTPVWLREYESAGRKRAEFAV